MLKWIRSDMSAGPNWKRFFSYLQVILGFLIAVGSVTACIYTVNAMMNLHQNFDVDLRENLGEIGVDTNLNSSTGQIYYNNALVRGEVGLFSLAIFIGLEVLIVVVCIMMILQGLVNLQRT